MKNSEPMLPLEIVQNADWWGEIEKAGQSKLLKEMKGLEQTMIIGTQSRITLGKHLSAIQEALAPIKKFNRFLQAYNLKRSTAFKAINSYKNAQKWLSEDILAAAAARNMNMLGESEDAPLGVYSTCVKRTPPPEDNNIDKINTWLHSIELSRRREIAQTRKRAEEVGLDEDQALKECFQFVNRRLAKMPTRSRVRTQWLEKLSGMLFRQIGVSTIRSIEPQAAPEEFTRGVGRPSGATIEGVVA